MATDDKNAKENRSQEIKVRVKLQKIMQDNMRHSMGMFHEKELNERGFINDLFKHFDITPKKI